MQRRDLFKTVSVAGGILAASRVALGQSRAQVKRTDRWHDWPFKEIRIPYQDRFGKIHWPNGSPLCVHVYITAEWNTNRVLSGRYTNLDDSSGEYYTRDLSLESGEDQYTFTVGIWRAVRMLEKFDIKATIFPNAGMVERYPDLFRELQSKGHEITCRSYDQGKGPAHFTARGEREEIRRCTAIHQKALGERPLGWISPGAKCTNRTPGILADAGYLWHGDLKGDDLPYGIQTDNGKKIVVIPHRTMTSNDFAIYPEGAGLKGLRSGAEAYEFCKYFFDSYYQLGQEEYPGALTYGIHPMRSCIPDRIGVHERILDYMLERKNAWFARYQDMAEHWMQNFMEV